MTLHHASRRRLLAFAAALSLAGGLALPLHAQPTAWPTKPIKLVVAGELVNPSWRQGLAKQPIVCRPSGKSLARPGSDAWRPLGQLCSPARLLVCLTPR